MQTIIDLLKGKREEYRNEIRKINKVLRGLQENEINLTKSPFDAPGIKKVNAKIKLVKQPSGHSAKADNVKWEKGIYHILKHFTIPLKSAEIFDELCKMKYFTFYQWKNVGRDRIRHRLITTLQNYSNDGIIHPNFHKNARSAYFIK